MKRNIIAIDQNLGTGCGACSTACAEGAIKIIRLLNNLITK